jgi:hypothetical protein
MKGKPQMKVLAGLLAIALSMICTISCDEAHKQTTAIVKTATNAAVEKKAVVAKDSDGDGDGSGGPTGRPDSDDHVIAYVGHPGRAADRREITSLIAAYYATAAAGNGTRACELTDQVLARAIPEDEGAKPYGLSFEQGQTTCPGIMTRTFKYFHNLLSAPVRVTAVRIQGDRSVVLIASKTLPLGSYMEARREGRIWKIDRYVAGRLP